MNTALIIVDVQHDFLEGGALAVPQSNEIVPKITQYMETYDFIVATMDWHPEHHISFASRHGKKIGDTIIVEHDVPQIVWPDHCVQETYGAELHREIAQHGHTIDYYLKKGANSDIDSYSAFFDTYRNKTELDDVLRSHKIQELHVCGLATDYCVYFTVIDALELGYRVGLLKQACKAVNLKEGDEEKAIHNMQIKGAFVL